MFVVYVCIYDVYLYVLVRICLNASVYVYLFVCMYVRVCMHVLLSFTFDCTHQVSWYHDKIKYLSIQTLYYYRTNKENITVTPCCKFTATYITMLATM